MTRLSNHALLAAALAALALASGCVADNFDRVSLGQSDRPAVLAAVGAEETPGGSVTTEQHNGWPTVIRVLHVAMPEGGLAEWKLQATGSVTHLLLFQVLSMDVLYQGPITEGLADRLRAGGADEQNEFLADLLRFVRSRTTAALPEGWTDVDQLRNDKYRSRMLGLFETTIEQLEGRGRVSRQRYNVDVDAPGASLRLRYLGSGIYRIETHGSAALAPSPVL